MFQNDLIDTKIEALLAQKGDCIDETKEEDLILYYEMRDFAEKHGGLLFNWGNETYLIINFMESKDFLFIPVEQE